MKDILLFAGPAGMLLVYLGTMGTDLAFGPTREARLLAWSWVIVGSLAAGRLSGTLDGRSESRLRGTWLRGALLLMVISTSYFFWCSQHEPLDVRAWNLLRERRAASESSTATYLTLELLSSTRGDPGSRSACLALAHVRERDLKVPGHGLYLSYLSHHHFLDFQTPRELLDGIRSLLRSADGTRAFSDEETFRTLLWRKMAPEAPWPLHQENALERAVEMLASKTKGGARSALAILSQWESGWKDVRFHQAAAQAWLILGEGARSSTEWTLGHILGPDSAKKKPLEAEFELAAQARSLFEKAKAISNMGRSSDAIRHVEEAFRTDPSIVPDSDQVWRANLESWIELEVIRHSSSRGVQRSPIDPYLGLDSTVQVASWVASARLIELAITSALLGRRDTALRTLDLIDSRFCPPYLHFQREACKAAWR